MNRSLLCMALLTLASTVANGSPDERAISITAKRTGTSADRIREAASSGCDGDMSSMNLCAEYQFVLADQRLNDVYSRVSAAYLRKPASLLRKSQRAWLSYRDEACTFESSGLEGGSAHAYSTLRCMGEKTATRISELEAYEACTQGGCPGLRR